MWSVWRNLQRHVVQCAFLWIKKEKDMLAVEKVFSTVHGGAVAVRSWCLNRSGETVGLVAGLQGRATYELVPDCRDTSITP